MLFKPSKEEKLAMDRLAEIEKNVDEIIAENRNAIKELEIQRSENDAKIEEARARVKQLERGIDAKALMNAKNELEVMTTQAAMIERELERYKTESWIPTEGIQQLRLDVNHEISIITKETEKRLAVKAREMRDEAWGLHDAVIVRNRILGKVQNQCDKREEVQKGYAWLCAMDFEKDTLKWATDGMNNHRYAQYDSMRKYPETPLSGRNYFPDSERPKH